MPSEVTLDRDPDVLDTWFRWEEKEGRDSAAARGWLSVTFPADKKNCVCSCALASASVLKAFLFPVCFRPTTVRCGSKLLHRTFTQRTTHQQIPQDSQPNSAVILRADGGRFASPSPAS